MAGSLRRGKMFTTPWGKQTDESLLHSLEKSICLRGAAGVTVAVARVWPFSSEGTDKEEESPFRAAAIRDTVDRSMYGSLCGAEWSSLSAMRVFLEGPGRSFREEGISWRGAALLRTPFTSGGV